MKEKLFAHQKTIFILSQQKEAQIKLYKTCEDKELDKVIALENKVKVLDNIVYKTGQSVQTMNMLNSKCRTSFAKPEFLKKAQRANPRLYDIDEVTNLQCDYLDLLEKCECLEKELSKSKMMSKSFESVQKHAINLELELQQCKEKIKNDKSFKDKGIAITQLKKLIEKLKGKSVETKFGKSLVIRKPNAFKSQRPSILGKPTIFSDSLERKDFSKSKSVTQNNVSNNFSKPVTAQILPLNKKSILKNTNVLAPGMYKFHTKPTQTSTLQLPNASKKTNKRMSFSTGVIPNTSVSRPQLKSNPIEDRVLLNNSQGKKQEVEDYRRNVKFSKNKTSITACNDSLNTKTLNVNFVCATCGKCVMNEKHDMCVLKSCNGVHSRTKMPIAMPIRTREPKHTVTQSVAKSLRKTVASEPNQKSRNITRKLYERVSKTCSWWYPKSKDETPVVLIDFLRLVQKGLHAQVRIVRTDKGSESLNWTLHAYFAAEGILHQTSVARTPEQNGSRAYRVFNKRTRVIVETIHVNFDEFPQMASNHVSSDPVSECQRTALKHDSLSPGPQCQKNVSHEAKTITMSNELDLLFSPMVDELLNGSSQVVSKSSAVTTADAHNQRQQQNTTPLNNHSTTDPTCQVPPQTPTVTSTENINQAKTISEYAQGENDEFIKIFCTPVQDRGETSSRHVDSSNMHTFYQHHPSEHRWMKDHPLEQVIGNPSQSVRTKRQLESYGEMCMFALTMSQTEPKNIKESVDDSAWIELMQEELY
nr:hypothetical protein [Tanacetum cinerariifolium]